MKKDGTTSQVTGNYVEFQAAVLRALPRDIKTDVALGWTKNGESLARILREALTPKEDRLIVDPRFTLLTTFQFMVPSDYDHSKQLAPFAEENREKFYSYNDNITDANFAKVTNRLTPGKTYEAKVFGITERVSSEDCLAFLKTQKALLVGAQGISVVWQQAKEQFPKGKWTVSFDEKDTLWQDADGSRRVPDVFQDSDGGWHFFLGYFEFDWYDDCCLLCLRDLSA